MKQTFSIKNYYIYITFHMSTELQNAKKFQIVIMLLKIVSICSIGPEQVIPIKKSVIQLYAFHKGAKEFKPSLTD